ncbi:uncharacterized protein [Acropora muricata]|uniref:uncharacterized protein n=1 Tax=Acropora muricata TaxID=159855 RepID=UPI0034E53EA1
MLMLFPGTEMNLLLFLVAMMVSLYKIWDLRQFQSGVAVAVFKHHTAPITSVEWHPSDSSVFAASGSDNQVTLLDLAVERETTRNPRKVEKNWKFHHNYSSSTWSEVLVLLLGAHNVRHFLEVRILYSFCELSRKQK